VRVSLEALLDKLEHADLDGLREEWRRRYGAPPRLRSKTLLRHVLAWRIQADLYDGLDPQTRKLLHDDQTPREPVVQPGTIIIREWRGVTHHIEATGDGFLYDGRRWKSLSEIARAITGTRWNGPRFFGLREARP
jgi:hypothetical protein